MTAHDFRDFEFHNSRMKLLSLSEGRFEARVENLVIHRCTEANPAAQDISVESGTVVFDGFELAAVRPGNDPSEAFFLVTGEEAEGMLRREFGRGVTVFDFQDISDELFSMEVTGEEPFFTVLFGFKNFTLNF